MLFLRKNFRKIAPRLISAVLELEKKSETDFIIIPKGDKDSKGLHLSVEIKTRVLGKKGMKPSPKSELTETIKAVSEAKKDWFSCKENVISIAKQKSK